MNVFACLLIGSLAVAVLAPRILPPLTRSGRAPRLAVTVWALAIASVAAAWLASPLLLLMDLFTPSHSFTRACLAVIGGAFAGDNGLAAQALLFAVALILVTRIAYQVGTGYRATRRRSRRHVDMTRIAGRRLPGLDAYVVDSEQTAAYCLPGPGHMIVLSSATIAVLSGTELAAVVAHERAHLAGHHHLLLRLSHGLHCALPRIRLFTIGTEELSRLLEMCADDAAARRHGRRAVIGALAALAGSQAPAGALAAGGATAAARITRLLAPEDRTAKIWIRLTLSITAVVLLLGPAATVLLAAHGLSLCPAPPA